MATQMATSTAVHTIRRPLIRVRPRQVAIGVLVTVTALVHLSLAAITVQMLATQPGQVATMGGADALGVMAALFACNFAGYVALGTGLYLPALRRFQRLTRRALIGYTAVTILAYFALAAGHYDPFGLTDKVCEGALIGLLLLEGRGAR